MDDQRKATAKLIIASKFKKPEEDEEVDAGEEGKLSAAEDLLTAIEGKDAKAVAEALQAAFDLCSGAEEKDQGEEEESSS